MHDPTCEREIFAHRGMPRVAPENTMASFRLAHEAGARWIETDVDILADDTPILIHDTDLDRTTNRSGQFYPLTAAALPSIDAGSWFGPEYAGEPLPRLSDLIAFANETGMNLNIELKANEQGAERTRRQIDAVLAELDSLQPDSEVIISSFSHPLLMAFHERAPEYAVGLLYTKDNLWPDWKSVAEFCGASYIHPQVTGLTREMVETFREAGYGVNVWTVNDAGTANQLFNWGCTGVFTDIADQFLR